MHDVAQRIDRHYNTLSSLRCRFEEHYSGMGQDRIEHGTLLLKKPGRMRWEYTSGQIFVLDGRIAVSYTPGDVEAHRLPAKQLDDLRSPLRYLLGHTQLEKELDGLTLTRASDGTAVLAGRPHIAAHAGDSVLRRISVRADLAGRISSLTVTAGDESTTTFLLTDPQENVPASDQSFRFTPPPGVTVIDGIPPS